MLFLCETLSLGVLVAENILRHKVTKIDKEPNR
jgi:uncharacterized membrane protein YsdA (DUF1294 family)